MENEAQNALKEKEMYRQKCNQLSNELEKLKFQFNSDPSKKMLNDSLRRIHELETQLRETESRQKLTRKPQNSKNSFKDLKKWRLAATKIQSVWRGFRQRQRYYDLIIEYVNKTRGLSKVQATDDMIMRQVHSAVKKRNLTLEQCFRAADSDSDDFVSCDDFIQFLNALKIELTQAQKSRLLLILDEDCSGKIEKHDFYNALAAYRVSAEHHNQSARTYEQSVLVKFAKLMQHREIQPEEIFNLCDTDGDDQITSKELEKFLNGLNVGFQQKEVHALLCLLVVDSSGTLSKEEFLKQMNKGLRAYKIDSMLATPKQAKKNLPALENSVKVLVEKMESHGTGVAEAFEMIEVPKSGKVTISTFSRELRKWFPHLETSDVMSIVELSDIDKNSMISLTEVKNTLCLYSDPSKLSVQQLLNKMTQKMQGLSVTEFLDEHKLPLQMDKDLFQTEASRVFELSPQQALRVFSHLDVDQTGEVSLKNLASVIESYNSGKSVLQEMSESPRTQRTKTILDFQMLLKEYGLEPMNVFRFADKLNSGSVQVSDFKTALVKLIPKISQKLLERVLELFEHSTITKEDLNSLFGAKEKLTLEQVYWLQTLTEAIEKLHTTPHTIFIAADLDQDEKATTSELKSAFKRCFPKPVLSNLEEVIKALDPNNKGTVQLKDFLQKLQEAKSSSYSKQALEEFGSKAKEDSVRKSSSRILDSFGRISPISFEEREQSSFHKFLAECPENSLTHQYTLTIGVRATELYNYEKFSKLCRRFEFSSSEVTEMFKTLDSHGKGLFYGFSFIAVLDSCRYKTNLPSAHNPSTSKATVRLINAMVDQLNKEQPLYQQLPLMTSPIDWDSLGDDFLIDEIYELKKAFEDNNFYYHLAYVLHSNMPVFIICTEQLMHCVLECLEIKQEACDYFKQYSVEPSDFMTKAEFTETLSKALSLPKEHSALIHYYLYSEKKISMPVYQFFTFFDMALSTYQDSVVTYSLPELPFSNSSIIDSKTKSFFQKLASSFTVHFSKLEVSLSDPLTPLEVSQTLERFCDIPQPALEPYISSLLLNQNQYLRLYHLLTVLDSYRSFPSNLMSLPKRALESLCANVPVVKNTTDWVQSRGYSQLNTVLSEKDFSELLTTLSKKDQSDLYEFLENQRGGVYTYTVCTLINLAHSFKGDLKEFPLNQNPRCSKQLRDNLLYQAKQLDSMKKSPYDYYLNEGVSPTKRFTKEEFCRQLTNEFSVFEAKELWEGLCLDYEYVNFYDYLSCLESYCQLHLTPQVKTKPISWGEQLTQVALKIPERVRTTDFFKEVQIHQLLDSNAFLALVQNKLELDFGKAKDLLKLVDIRNLGAVFAFELFTRIDLLRSCAYNGSIQFEMQTLPFSNIENANYNTFKKLANKLDELKTGICDYYLRQQAELNSVVNLREFINCNPDLTNKESTLLYESVDINSKGRIWLYHFLAVLESYRSQALPSTMKITEIKRSSSLSYEGLKDALTKFQEYIQERSQGGEVNPREIFGEVDLDSDGIITTEEFINCLDALPLNLKESQKLAIIKEADINNDGQVDYEEFVKFLSSFKQTKPKRIQRTSTKQRKRMPTEVKGMNFLASDFKEDSLDLAIHKLKEYLRDNLGSFTSLEQTFKRLDEEDTGFLNETEFNLALERLRLGLSKVQRDLLIEKADIDNTGDINYYEFIEFLFDYEFEDFETDKSLNSLSESFVKQTSLNNLNPIVEIKNYIIEPQKDYLNPKRKCTTILNSEIAALKRCVELLEGVGVFKDPDFGPEQPEKGAYCLYWNGKPPSSNFPPPEELAWKAPSEWMDNVCFFDENISSNDVIQGSLGDCWFIGALSVLAIRDELIRGGVHQLESPAQVDLETASSISLGVYPPIFHSFARKGLYVLKFFKDCAPRWVIVDQRLPVFVTEGQKPQFVFGKCKNEEELWVPLIEKAYAKLHGCYEALNGGLIDDGLVDLTGHVAEKIKLRGKGGLLEVPVEEQKTKNDQLWERLKKLKAEGTLMGCSIDGEGIESQVIKEGEVTGLLAKHAYGIIDVIDVPSPNAKKNKHRLLRIRNPWGDCEWKGKWSDNHEKLQENIAQVMQYVDRLGEDEKFDPNNPNDGTFLMSFKDWRNIFDNLMLSIDFPEEWWGKRFKGEWTAENSGGVPTSPNKAHAERWAKNPQYVVELRSKSEVFISLTQQDGRYFKDACFPFEDQINTACFSIMKLSPEEEKLESFDQSRIVKLSVLKLHRELHLRHDLLPGKYVIVPSTMHPGKTGVFWLSVYFSAKKKYVNFYESEKPEDEGEEIVEEEEISKQLITEGIIQDLKELVAYLTSI